VAPKGPSYVLLPAALLEDDLGADLPEAVLAMLRIMLEMLECMAADFDRKLPPV